MIISRGRRYIFVHIPKTGGTSLALALEDRAMRDDILIGDTPKAKKRRAKLKGLTPAGRLWKHSTLADIDGIVTPEDLEAFFVFTLVRNPWDRMVSYYHWLRAQRFDHPTVGLAQRLDFASFLQHPHTRVAVKSSPYGHYLCDARGVDRANLFLRLEHLAEDLAPLEAHLGFALDAIPHANASERQADYRSYYDDALAETLAGLCAGDIARFGYRF